MVNSSEDSIDVKESKKILDEDHYGLEKVKERIIEYLAVRALKMKKNLIALFEDYTLFCRPAWSW